MTSRDDRPFDIVLFGATSFVGQILCRYLVDRHGIGPGPGTDPGGLRWAIAGRSTAKLDAVAAATGATVPQIVADASSATDMASLADSTRVVVSTVGPYALYGSELVAACAAAGTDYCDLTGEPQWMQKMIDAHYATAQASGARIVHTCGFDSIPSDLGVWFTQHAAIEEFGEPCTTIAMRVKAMRGGASGGTIASMMNVLEETAGDPALRKMLANPYALAPDGMRSGVDQPNVLVPKNDEASGEWIAPFVMAAINTRVVHRSHALLGRPWGDDFLYDEAMMMGAGPKGAAKAAGLAGGLGGFVGIAALRPARRLLNRFVLPKPGDGPSPEAQEKGFFDIRFFGTTASGRTIATKVTGDRDPGYGSTARMLGECAVTLLHLPRDGEAGVAGGFWTPSTALGDTLIEALQAHAGLTFDVL
ncbi:MAG: saccharopine dehydrogenase NADP-binding domain-containing protein [Acidimicrobiales bacterium]